MAVMSHGLCSHQISVHLNIYSNVNQNSMLGNIGFNVLCNNHVYLKQQLEWKQI